MKKALSAIALTLIIAVLCVSFAGCSDSQKGDIVYDVDYSQVLKYYELAPDAVNVASMESQRDGAKVEPVNITEIYQDYQDGNLSISDAIAQMVDGATYNEIACDHFAYFTNKIGSTKLGSNEGSLIYQRLRKQNDLIKDDTTIKLPVNHNFDAIASTTVTAADIRYVSEGKYKRMNTANKNIKYNFTTGILEVGQWKKESAGNWNKDEDAKGSRSYSEARKSVINWEMNGIVSAEGAKIELKQDDKGNAYYELTFSIDVDVANADKSDKDDKNNPTHTINRLENDNGGSNMKFEYCNMVVQIWECGLAKRYDIDESWSGKIVAYSGSAQSKQVTVFSYAMDDMDSSKTDAIYKSIK